MRRTRWAAAALAAAAAGLAGGCGGAEDDAADPPDRAGTEPASFPVTVEATNGRVTVPRAPERIVSLSPTATEMLFAVGAGDQVVAVDDQSDYPGDAPQTDLSAYQPSLEAIAGYRPDLVVVSDTSPPDVVEGLERLGVTVIAEPSAKDLAGAYDQIRDLGRATGHRAEAMRVVDRMRSRLERLFRSAPPGEGLRVYHELQPDLYSASSETFIGGIYERLGLRNVADRAARASGSIYPKLSAEYVVSADPDLVVLADTECCGMTPAKVARRPGWDEVAAVEGDDVVAVDTDVAARWGPRLPQFVERVVAALRDVREPAR